MPDPIDNLSDDGLATLAAREVFSGDESLPGDLCIKLHRIMARSRALEERMVKMSKSGQGYFWIGGPGEEAFNACLGMQIKKGQGPHFDYLHLHYRNSATLVAMGMDLVDGVRQMAMTIRDPHSAGRNFPGHFARRDWNVIPVTSVIEVQYIMAPGTALMQKRTEGSNAVTVVTGGEAGTAEGDFASCLVWSTRPGNELPVLMIVMNNGWGISTPANTQHGEKHVIDRGTAFGIPGALVDGNDPVASWHCIARAMEYCRQKRRPYMIEASVSRLHGHSSSSGAARVHNEVDCIAQFEEKLLAARLATREELQQVRSEAEAEAEDALQQALRDPMPTPADVYKFTYAASSVDAVYPGDYTGLPDGMTG